MRRRCKASGRWLLLRALSGFTHRTGARHGVQEDHYPQRDLRGHDLRKPGPSRDNAIHQITGNVRRAKRLRMVILYADPTFAQAGGAIGSSSDPLGRRKPSANPGPPTMGHLLRLAAEGVRNRESPPWTRWQ